MQFSGFSQMIFVRTAKAYCKGFRMLPLLLISLMVLACTPLPTDPVAVCREVAKQVPVDLPMGKELQVNEQEIHGERIVVHLNSAGENSENKLGVICVFAAERYQTDTKRRPYSLVPTRMAVNEVQMTELELLKAIKAAGFKVE